MAMRSAVSALRRLAVASVAAIATLAGADAGAADTESRALDALARHVAAGAEAAGRPLVGATVSQEGHWTFVNRSGERMTAASTGEITRALATLLPAAAGADGDASKPAIVFSAAALLRHRAYLKDLPRGGDWQVLVGDTVHAVRRAPPDLIAVEIRPRVLLEMRDEAGFEEAMAQLARPLRREQLRVLSLEIGGPQTLPVAARVDARTQRPLPDAIDPGVVTAALSRLGGQTVVVTGRVDDGRLLVRSGSGLGGDAAVPVADLKTAAANADVDLVILRAAAARQPATRNWLWQRVDIRRLDRAVDRPSLGDFLSDLVPDDDALWLAARPADATSGGRRTALTATMRSATGGIGDKLGSVGAVLASAVAEVTGSVTIVGIEADLRSVARQRELDRRLLPGLNSIGQLGYLGLVIAGLAGLPTALGWFARIWPPERRSEYDGAAGHLAARLVRGLVFALVALPLLAVPALLATVLGTLARLVGRSSPSAGAAA